MHDDAIAAFWADARVRGGLNPVSVALGETGPANLPPPAWSFGSNPAQADRLLELVLAGRKTATASAYWDYEQDARDRAHGQGTDRTEDAGDVLVGQRTDVVLPEAGLFSIVLDGAGTPKALIRTTHVDVVPFGEVDEVHALREGEGGLEEWRREHRRFFAQTAPAGSVVDDSTPVVLERFVVVVPATARRAARRAGLL